MDWIALLPPSWQPWAHGLVTTIASVSVALLGLKPLLGDPSPEDPAWKRIAFVVLGWADFVATNSTPIAAKHEIAELKRESLRPGPSGIADELEQ